MRDRSRRAAEWLFVTVVLLWLLLTALTARLRPDFFPTLAARPLAWLATVVFVVALAASAAARHRARDLAAFVCSGLFLLGLLGATAATVFPVMIRSTSDPTMSLTALNASSGPTPLAYGLVWWPVGLVLAIAYVAVLFRLHRGRVGPADGGSYGS